MLKSCRFPKKILVTGGSGFIGSELIRNYIRQTDAQIVNVDKINYAVNSDALKKVENSENYFFEHLDIVNADKLKTVFLKYRPDTVIHLAAESHVDRSIQDPSVFIYSNIVGTFNLLKIAQEYWSELSASEKMSFCFLHVSTDEVYGDLEQRDPPCKEETRYRPSSPYSSTKAASDHLARAWFKTYGLPVIVSTCSNNYGPYQFPEKLIPLTIINAIKGKPITVYGQGLQIRDWIFVSDHVQGLMKIVRFGTIGDTYNIGASNERKNIDVVSNICEILEDLKIQKPFSVNRFSDLISFVPERLGHDYRYALDASKIIQELGWAPQENFETGLCKTVAWYVDVAGSGNI